MAVAVAVAYAFALAPLSSRPAVSVSVSVSVIHTPHTHIHTLRSGCLLMRIPSSRRCAVRRGSTRMHRKSKCSTIHLDPYRMQCVVRGRFGNLFVHFCRFHFPLPHAHIVAPKLSRTHTLIHPLSLPIGTHITHNHTPVTHIHIHTLLTPLPVFSPQSRDEFKRAVDDCQSVPG